MKDRGRFRYQPSLTKKASAVHYRHSRAIVAPDVPGARSACRAFATRPTPRCSVRLIRCLLSSSATGEIDV